MHYNHILMISILSFQLASVGSAEASGKAIYPKNVEDILYQRDLHGATQAYLWGQTLATSYAFMDGNLRVADQMDFVTYTTPFEKPSKTKFVSVGDAEYRGWGRFGIDYWKDLHEMIQDEPMGPEDAMALEFLKRIGIEKGKPFAPDERQRKIMLEAESMG
jgi:hypothetical protein